MTAKDFKQIPLDKCKPNPWNPRDEDDFKGERFEELTASIRKVGVLSPILVRPSKKDTYEIIFGERRYRAALLVAKDNGGVKKATIPAIVREMTDDDAFDACLIENLQRKDLTELQEANTFKAWVERRAKKEKKLDAIKDLSDRTGKGARYIRRRIAILSLPAEVLKAWDKGLITIGHCEQLTRLGDDKKKVLEYLENCTEQWDPLTVADLRREIDEEAIPMKNVWFDQAAAGCQTCHKNTEVQRELLFGDEGEEAKKHASCLDPKCYLNNQGEALRGNWETRFKKKWGTNGFRFQRDVNLDFGRFNGKKGTMHKDFAEKCLLCEHFVTIIEDSGKPHWEQACDDMSCYRKLKNGPVQQQAARASSEEQSGLDASADDSGRESSAAPVPSTPRVSWHGRHFREEFFAEVLPSWISALQPDDDKCLRLVLAGVLNSNITALEYHRKHTLSTAGNCRGSFDSADWKAIEGMDGERLRASLKDIGGYIAMQADKTSHETRCAIAAHLGIDLARDWRITESYLEKKTKAEILAFGEQLGIFADPKAQAFLKDTLGKRKFSSLKKNELDRVILESGVDLSGKVPAEILDSGFDREEERLAPGGEDCPRDESGRCSYMGRRICKHQGEPICCYDCEDGDEDCPSVCPKLAGEPVCRVCGCSEDDACEGGCTWVEEDLCSVCEGKV